jgi:hypothetical protein
VHSLQVQKVTDAVKLVKEARPDLMVEGPLQYDAAIDPTVASVKIKTASEVAGRATVFVFPDLNTGNNTYKAVQQVGWVGGCPAPADKDGTPLASFLLMAVLLACPYVSSPTSNP